MLYSENRREFTDSARVETSPVTSEEMLVSDARSGMRTEEILDNKLGYALARAPNRRDQSRVRVKPR